MILLIISVVFVAQKISLNNQLAIKTLIIKLAYTSSSQPLEISSKIWNLR